MTTTIHPTAVVSKKARLGERVFIGPFCTVADEVQIGDDTELKSHVVVMDHVQLGGKNKVWPFAVLGGDPQDSGYRGEATKLVIGDRNLIRESVTLHRGSPKDRGVTQIGHDNFLMAYVHVAHDAVVGHHVTLVNGVNLAGHVQVGDYSVIGGLSAITQWVRLGESCFVGAGSVLRRDLPPFMTAKDQSEVSGPNLVGLKRRGYSEDDIRLVRELYKTLYLANLTTEKALEAISSKWGDATLVQNFLTFVRASKVGIQR